MSDLRLSLSVGYIKGIVKFQNVLILTLPRLFQFYSSKYFAKAHIKSIKRYKNLVIPQ